VFLGPDRYGAAETDELDVPRLTVYDIVRSTSGGDQLVPSRTAGCQVFELSRSARPRRRRGRCPSLRGGGATRLSPRLPRVLTHPYSGTGTTTEVNSPCGRNSP
jgi:hypothetical protein